LVDAPPPLVIHPTVADSFKGVSGMPHYIGEKAGIQLKIKSAGLPNFIGMTIGG
jgi:hypothetical protein